MGVIEELKWRGLIYDITKNTATILEKRSITLYNGFDPSSDSLHIGHLIPLIGLSRFQRAGCTPIALIGGGTGLIGDPSGKSSERLLMDEKKVRENVECIRKQIFRVLDFNLKNNSAIIVDNYQWLSELSALTLLRDIGKFFTINNMINKDSIQNRLEKRGELSYTEFSYLILQAYDFFYLNKKCGCQLQTGGSDQWGNITAGIEFIRKKNQKKAYGLVYPLLVKDDGKKIGKTEEGTIWLDANKTSPYKFYQFWLNTEDNNIVKYLKYYSWLTLDQIEEIECESMEKPENRIGQKILAKILTELIHGFDALSRCIKISNVLFGEEIDSLTDQEITDLISDIPTIEISKTSIEEGEHTIINVVNDSNLFTSKGEIRRCILDGGLYLNNVRVTDEKYRLSIKDLINGKFILIRKGKKNNFAIKIIN